MNIPIVKYGIILIIKLIKSGSANTCGNENNKAETIIAAFGFLIKVNKDFLNTNSSTIGANITALTTIKIVVLEFKALIILAWFAESLSIPPRLCRSIVIIPLPKL